MTTEKENELESSSLTSEENLLKLDTLTLEQFAIQSNQTLSSIIENTTQITTIDSTSLTNIEKEINGITDIKSNQISLLTDSNQISSIHYIDSSSIEDQETKSSLSDITNSLNRKISLSESDLLSSLHRNINKQQTIDNQSDNDIIDDILFIEWDKERNLFQDYINSLRKEIRVLLQERLDYQTQTHTEFKHTNDHQIKIDLLQKSLEEKNFIIEQLQIEYELMKEKNINLSRKISYLESDTKSQINIIDELKQNLTDLTVDLQNHILIKRRLEMSINNLENNCQLLDIERIKLTNDVKDNQHNKQDLEKLLQKANVRIAEQGSTIEMLRSENVQVRSQLSTIQRRMFQEKQQIMDYLRQIEDDLIEKERLKQHELLLRQDYEQLQLINKQDQYDIQQLKNSIYQDQQTLEKLQQEYSQLLKIKDNEKFQLELELNNYKSEIKRLYSHFNINIDSIEQLIPILEDRLLQTSPISSTSEFNNEYEQLRKDFENLTIQYKQLDEANQTWKLNQLRTLHDRFKLDNTNNLSFDDTIQQIENRFNDLQNQYNTIFNRVIELEEISTKQTGDNNIQSIENQRNDELQQLQEHIVILTTQCAQFDEANRAWQQFQQAQLDNFRNKFKHILFIDNNLSLDQIGQLLIDFIQKQDKHSEILLSDSIKQIHMTPSEEESIQNLISVQSASSFIDKDIEELRQLLNNKCTELDEVNHAWKQFQQDQIQNFRNQLHDYFTIDENLSFDQIPQLIIDQITKDRDDFNQQYEILQKTNDELRSESETNLETIKQSYTNTINELNQELLILKEELEKQTNSLNQQQFIGNILLIRKPFLVTLKSYYMTNYPATEKLSVVM
ncbi:unnamed protein product [Rotaria sp. Silwood1]|nr:unnamed protein product [Rotaria sp. Silwood1]